MKNLLKSEELFITAVAVYFLTRHALGWSWWVWLILFFSPDISMLGYLAGTKIGAYAYNLFHHRGIAIIISAGGFVFQRDALISLGILLFAHASFDRIWGYGLKFDDDFKHTHLGWLADAKKNTEVA
jgi:hypothetical protein